ncbi:MAG: hypothetical protein L6Q71_04945 [Planctomycetes bacterium]|nr:hypothetical protein [Planctomycetota bacterium]NUQ33347.1 hypothetical protein [Planctomycetaceae bacterium]
MSTLNTATKTGATFTCSKCQSKQHKEFCSGRDDIPQYWNALKLSLPRGARRTVFLCPSCNLDAARILARWCGLALDGQRYTADRGNE